MVLEGIFAPLVFLDLLAREAADVAEALHVFLQGLVVLTQLREGVNENTRDDVGDQDQEVGYKLFFRRICSLKKDFGAEGPRWMS